MVDLQAIAAYEPRWPGVKELNLADQWRARWVDEQELPPNAPVHHLYALVVMGDKGYATREKGGNRWEMVDAPVGDVTVDVLLVQAVKERTGATVGRSELIGFLECRPTRQNTEFKQGDITVRPLYLVVAKKLDDLPAGSNFERRRFPLSEYMVAMRARYPELLDYLGKASGRYALIQAKG
jgi:hypothetical protein